MPCTQDPDYGTLLASSLAELCLCEYRTSCFPSVSGFKETSKVKTDLVHNCISSKELKSII